jgi:hypothetical protein
MKVVLLGLGATALAFCLHLLVWRIRIPHRQTRALLLIFVGVFVVCAGLVTLWLPARFLAPDDAWGLVHATLFFLAMLAAYIITYTAIEADSPTLVMVMRIRESGPDGLEREAFDRMLTDELLVLPRLRDMLRDGTAVVEHGHYRLTPKGLFMAKIFTLYRNLLGGNLGG